MATSIDASLEKKMPDNLKSCSWIKQRFQTLRTCLDKEKSETNHTPKLFTDTAGQRGLSNMSIGNLAIKFSIYFFEPKSINSCQDSVEVY